MAGIPAKAQDTRSLAAKAQKTQICETAAQARQENQYRHAHAPAKAGSAPGAEDHSAIFAE